MLNDSTSTITVHTSSRHYKVVQIQGASEDLPVLLHKLANWLVENKTYARLVDHIGYEVDGEFDTVTLTALVITDAK